MAKMTSIDWDTRVIVLKYCSKYGPYKARYETEREAILEPSTPRLHGLPGTRDVGDPTLSSVVRLDKLESAHYVRVIRAIDNAKKMLALDIENEQARETVKSCIWDSCLNRKKYNYESMEGILPVSRATFYRYKNEFLNDIKYRLGL